MRVRSAAYRPEFSDSAFIACLSSSSTHLCAAKVGVTQNDLVLARRYVVEHFLHRNEPRFFLDRETIPKLALQIRRDRAPWVEKLRERVDADLNRGLSVVSIRAGPLSGAFDWTQIPLGPGGDKLFSVQPHRYGFMPRLALAAHHEVATLPVIRNVVDQWMAATSAGSELSYLSPLVVLYRVLALSWTFELIAALEFSRGSMDVDLLFQILKIIFADSTYLNGTLGDSYPNNHLLADGFAGWYCGMLYPEFPDAICSKAKGEAIFIRELHRQFYEDGTSFEHSTHYHELGCEMAVAYTLLLRRNRIDPAPSVIDRLRRMLAFQAALGGVYAVPLPIGDSTEDPLFPLDVEHGWGTGAMRELYRALFAPELSPQSENDSTVERAWWLLGGNTGSPFDSAGDHACLPTAFEQGGFYVLKDSALGAHLVFRSGPTEGLPISAGHAHADLLSINLLIGKVPLIVDAGTFTYRLDANEPFLNQGSWRSYFAGPRSHNGLIIPDDPYGELQGDFRGHDIPCRVKPTRRETAPGLTWLEFEVTGDNVASGHRRGIVHVEGQYWVVYDIVPTDLVSFGASIGLQFAPGTVVALVDDVSISARLGRAYCKVASVGLRDPQVLTGSLDPVGGWVCQRYGELSAAPQFRAHIAPKTNLCGMVLQAADIEPKRLYIVDATTEGSSIRFQIGNDKCVDSLLLMTGSELGPVKGWNIEHDGALVWIRSADNDIREVRRLGDGAVRYRGKQVASVFNIK